MAVAANRPAVSTNEKKADKSWSNVAASNKQEDVIDYFDFTDWQNTDKQLNLVPKIEFLFIFRVESFSY